jgi:phosphomannomutase
MDTANDVRAFAQSAADDLHQSLGRKKTVFLGYSRNGAAKQWAEEYAKVIAANGHTVLFSTTPVSWPLLFFGIRYFGLRYGVYVMPNGRAWIASHKGGSYEIRKKSPRPPSVLSLEEGFRKSRIQKANCLRSYLSHVFQFVSPSGKGGRNVVCMTATEEVSALMQAVFRDLEIPVQLFGLRAEEAQSFTRGTAPVRLPQAWQPGNIGIVAPAGLTAVMLLSERGEFVSPLLSHVLVVDHLLGERNWKGKVANDLISPGAVLAMAGRYRQPVVALASDADTLAALNNPKFIAVGTGGRMAIPRHLPVPDGLLQALLILEHLDMANLSLDEWLEGVRRTVGRHVWGFGTLEANAPEVAQRFLESLVGNRWLGLGHSLFWQTASTWRKGILRRTGDWLCCRIRENDGAMDWSLEASTEEGAAMLLDVLRNAAWMAGISWNPPQQWMFV